MKILITGGAGFLGLHLAKYRQKSEEEKKEEDDTQKIKLYLLDIADFDKKEYPKNCQFIKADVRDKKFIDYLFNKEKFDFVIHAAAALPLWNQRDIFEINITGTKNILELSFKNKVKRVIFISSTAVYGVPKKYPIFEDDSLVGVGPYGQSKIEAEKICWQFIKKGLKVTILRPKTFVGTHRLGVFEILFDWIKDGKKIPVIGNGCNRYQLLDVDDLVEVIYLIINKQISEGRKRNNDKKLNEVFNIGAEKFGTVRQDLEELFEYAYQQKVKNQLSDGCRKIKNFKKSSIIATPAFLVKKILWFFEKLKISPLYQWVYDTADHDSFVSIEKVKKTLNWQPKFSNAQALIKAYQWYLDNYQEIKSHPTGVTHRVGWRQGILGWIKRFC
ncbi:MAG: NAD-dependent epimerase/dehydratase family protein [Microgenomates group bacterium]